MYSAHSDRQEEDEEFELTVNDAMIVLCGNSNKTGKENSPANKRIQLRMNLISQTSIHNTSRKLIQLLLPFIMQFHPFYSPGAKTHTTHRQVATFIAQSRAAVAAADRRCSRWISCFILSHTFYDLEAKILLSIWQWQRRCNRLLNSQWTSSRLIVYVCP